MVPTSVALTLRGDAGFELAQPIALSPGGPASRLSQLVGVPAAVSVGPAERRSDIRAGEISDTPGRVGG